MEKCDIDEMLLLGLLSRFSGLLTGVAESVSQHTVNARPTLPACVDSVFFKNFTTDPWL